MQTRRKKTDIAWAAGIIDGEGTITLIRNQTTNPFNIVPRVLCTMTDRKTIDRLFSLLPHDKSNVRRQLFKSSPNHKYRYAVQVGSQHAVKACKLLLPYLVTKKRQAELIIAYSNECMLGRRRKPRHLTSKEKNKRINYLRKMQRLNKRGI